MTLRRNARRSRDTRSARIGNVASPAAKTAAMYARYMADPVRRRIAISARRRERSALLPKMSLLQTTISTPSLPRVAH